MSAYGPSRTWRNVRLESGIRTIADIRLPSIIFHYRSQFPPADIPWCFSDRPIIIRNVRHPGGFFLSYGACVGRAGNVNRSNFEIGLVLDSDGSCALPKCPQNLPRIHLKTD